MPIPNFENTCFLNGLLQAFLSTEKFTANLKNSKIGEAIMQWQKNEISFEKIFVS